MSLWFFKMKKSGETQVAFHFADLPTVVVTVLFPGISRTLEVRMPVYVTGQSLTALRGHQGKDGKTPMRRREIILEKHISKKTCLFL